MIEYNGCELPEDLWYDLDYLWARPNDDGTFTVGLTDPAQTMAGRVVAAGARTVAACGGLLAWSAFVVFSVRIVPVLRHPDRAQAIGP